jgi:hypothetical protein
MPRGRGGEDWKEDVSDREMEPRELSSILARHKAWLENPPDGKRAKLDEVNLQDANLEGANIDYATLTFWCGTTKMKIDHKLGAQLAYHFCTMECDDAEVRSAQAALRTLANKFHKVGVCGEIRPYDETKQEEQS